MMNLGLYAYLGAAIAYGFFAILLLFSWRCSLQGKFLTVAVVISAIWAGLAADIAADGAYDAGAYQVFEILRYIAWYIFLLRLLDSASARNPGYLKFLRWALPLSIGFACLLLIYDYFVVLDFAGLSMPGHVFLAIIALAIIEQLFRNTAIRYRWSIKYLFIGAGCIFAFDFFLYVDAVLFRGFDQELWEIRGIVNLVAVPMLAIAAVRNKDWSLNVFVSRDIVLYTTAITAGALYLLVMAGAGYYLAEYGGSWGRITQVVFLSLAVVLLVILMFSGRLRARIRVFLGKHFYKNKYDYRREWLRLTGELSDKGQGEGRFDMVVQVLAQLVDARAGLLWLREDQGQYINAAAWNENWISEAEPNESRLVKFLEETGFVINLKELETHADEYQGLDVPAWVANLERPWLVVPLFGLDSLLGFVVLGNPLIDRSINWEDRDLLKTAAKQVASYLAVLRTSDALAEAKQFELFNRLSAYMVHDLKNIAAELKLVALNAEKHKDNPGFLEDAFATVDDAAGNINRLLEQIRNRRARTEKKSIVDLGSLIHEVVTLKQNASPPLHLDASSDASFVVAEKDRLANVLAHLIDNAQQATGAEGAIKITLASKASVHIVEIRDNGHGMDADFIRNRLFKPFDTTKGNAGMGIGMYESRDYIRHLGGEMYVESEPGKGTTVSLHLPSSPEHSATLLVTA
jgi:putative PEP-CTERM system histidine kinase